MARDPDPQRATIRDVAREAGVSAKTVSRVINGEQTVAPATAERVRDAVDRLGFRPDQMARSLRSGQRVRLAGLILSDLTNPHVTALADGVEDTVRTRGHTLVLSNANEDHEQESALIDELLRRHVEGLVVVPSGSHHEHLRVAAQRVPIVCVHRQVPEIDVTVRPDDVGGTRRGVGNLLAAGHERIAFVGDMPFIHNIQERLRGFREAHEEAGVPVVDDLVRLGCHTSQVAEEAVTDLLSARRPPTAIFAANNLNCLGTLRAVMRHRSETAVVGFDELPAADFVGIPVTLLTYDQREMGSIAGQLLMDRIHGTESGPRTVVVPVEEHHHEPFGEWRTVSSAQPPAGPAVAAGEQRTITSAGSTGT